MCKLMTADKATSLQFFELDEFVKIRNGYRTALGIHCMWRGTIEKEPEGTLRTVCERDKYCNAVLHMDVIKKGSQFIGTRPSLMIY